MARRVSLPSADDLFRPTAPKAVAPEAEPSVRAVPDVGTPRAVDSEEPGQAGRRKPSGRVRHDEKMTVYITSDELLEIEHVRLSLRRNHGLAVDRGRLVREAVAMVLAEFEAQGEQSALVRRLIEE